MSLTSTVPPFMPIQPTIGALTTDQHTKLGSQAGAITRRSYPHQSGDRLLPQDRCEELRAATGLQSLDSMELGAPQSLYRSQGG